MSFWFGVAGAAMSTLGEMDNYAVAAARAKAAKAQQEYNNKMARVSDALNQNAITTNVSMAVRQSAMESEKIQRRGLEVVSAASTQAGATGTIGTSVKQSVLAIKAAEAGAQYTREEKLKASFVAADQQRMTSTLSANMQQDYSPIEKPSAMRSLLNMSAKSLSAMMSMGGSTDTSENAPPQSFTTSSPGSAFQYGWDAHRGSGSFSSDFGNAGLNWNL